jgi:hypothetical protein
VLKGDELSSRDGQTARRAFIDHAKRDDPIDVREWEGMQ